MTETYYMGSTNHIFRGSVIDGPVPDHFRPVVVIDPTDREAVQRLAAAVLDYQPEPEELADWEVELLGDSRELIETTDALQAALREFAAPTPPRPEEPQGLGAVVETDGGVRYVRLPGGHWTSEDESQPWRYLNAVRVLSEGVTA